MIVPGALLLGTHTKMITTKIHPRHAQRSLAYTQLIRSFLECRDPDLVGATLRRLYPAGSPGSAPAFQMRGAVDKAIEKMRTQPAPEVTARSAVQPGTTDASSPFGPLSPIAPYAEAFIEYQRPMSAFGRLAASMKKVPFRSKVPRGTAGASTGWVAEAGVIPVTSETFDSIDTANEKMASIIVVTDDLIRFGDPDVDALLREDLARSSAVALDTSFLDPTSGAVAGVRPSSITSGLSPIASTGNIATDAKALLNAVTTELVSPFLVMRPRLAANIAGLNTQLTRDLTVDGGTLAGIPVVVTGNMPRTANSPADDQVVLLDADSIQYADGGIDISVSNEATIMMDTAPDSPPIASSVATSFFQNNLTGLRLIRYVTWKVRRSGAVALMTGASY